MSDSQPPPTVIVLGASEHPEKFGNKSVRAHMRQGYHVIPVNPKGGTIEGLPVVTSLKDIAGDRVNRITVYLPPAITAKILPEIAAIEHDELWLNPGAANEEVIRIATSLGLDPIQACSIVDIGEVP